MELDLCLLVEIVHLNRGCHLCSDWTGMLRRWDDSQRFLAEYHHLICEETANYLILWCFRLQAEHVSAHKLDGFCSMYCSFMTDPDCVDLLQKEALMEQVAHQAVVMQFILEMARNTQQDPRGCFRQFFQKAKVRLTSADITSNLCKTYVHYTSLPVHDLFSQRGTTIKSSRLFAKIHYWSKIQNN